MYKILVGIPCLYGYQHTEDAINSLLNQKDVDVLLIENGAESDIKRLIKNYSSEHKNISVIHNEENVYVNPAWNQIIKYFLEHSDYDYLVIMNSDLVMQKDWSEVLRARFTEFKNETLLPKTIEDVTKIKNTEVNTNQFDSNTVYEGTAGIFITLSRSQADMVYPITEECKVWYGDNCIYGILRGLGHDTVIPYNLIAHHGLSQTIHRLTGVDKIIAVDTELWNTKVKNKMEKVINEQRNKSK